MKTDSDHRWYYGVGSQPETYYEAGNSREEAISEALGNDGGTTGFTIIHAACTVPVCSGVFHTDHVLEQYEERNEECWGEDGAEINANAAQAEELETELTAVLDAWMERHGLRGYAWSLGDYRHEEYFPPSPEPEVAA